MIHDYSRANPSPRYRQLVAQYRQLHTEGDPRRNLSSERVYAGDSLLRQAMAIKQLVNHFGAKTLLDYGAGKGSQYQVAARLDDGRVFSSIGTYWGIEEVICYDPAYEPFNRQPEGRFDGVVSTDVLEHVPEEDVLWVLGEMFSYARKFLFINAAAFRAAAHLPNGENAHCTIRPTNWWHETIATAAADYPEVRYFLSVEMGRDRPAEVVCG